MSLDMTYKITLKRHHCTYMVSFFFKKKTVNPKTNCFVDMDMKLSN